MIFEDDAGNGNFLNVAETNETLGDAYFSMGSYGRAYYYFFDA